MTTSTGSSSTKKLNPSLQMGFLEPDTIELHPNENSNYIQIYGRIINRKQYESETSYRYIY